jgi:tetratricopeptide (TPR) repeat protein/tRNA A-37 threonylcarbamoyl transferase component Bud32
MTGQHTTTEPAGELSDTLAQFPDTLAESDRPSGSAVHPRALIGRYLVLHKLGAGAMGMVFAAYDPQLDRKVALKLLMPSSDHGASRIRLQREAQALAKLDHQNVVTVHDVGMHEQQLFVAMELVDGRDLGAWMKSVEQPHPWREVVQVYMQAGRGLAAAHGVGLVHRDFKPANVMLGADGRVRVMDFGLARIGAGQIDAGLHDRAADADSRESSLLEQDMTMAGSLLGTLAYMSAEQLEARPADAQSDQFSFCVALYETLYGERPFAGQTLTKLRVAVDNERISEPPPGSKVPTWLRKIVVRGLAKDPNQRWPSMQVLVEALANDPSLRRRKWMTAAGLLAFLGAALWGAHELSQRGPQACEGMQDKLAGAWDATRRTELEAAFLGIDHANAAAMWDRVEQNLDDYADAWVAARVDACEATLRGEQSGELLDLRMACLDQRRSHLSATVDELARIDAALLPRAIDSVLALPGIEHCADASALTAEIPLPENPATAEHVLMLDERLTQAWAKQNAGRPAEGLALADAALADAITLGYEPLRARALRRQGDLQMRMGNYQEAEATLKQAYDIALGEGMLPEASVCASQLVFLIGQFLARPDDARSWATHADPLSRVIGDDERRAAYFDAVGALAMEQREFQQARADFEAALELRERSLGPDRIASSLSLNNLGAVAEELGQFEQARDYHERALAIRERVLGPDHELVADSHYNLASVAIEEKRYEDARAYYERALAIREAMFGPEHPTLAAVLSNMAHNAKEQGKYDEARRYYERAMLVRERALGPEHPHMVYLWAGLGQVLFEQHELTEAIPLLEHALTVGTANNFPPGLLAAVRFALARSLWSVSVEQQRDRARARELAELSRSAFAELGARSAEDLAQVEAWLAEIAADLAP